MANTTLLKSTWHLVLACILFTACTKQKPLGQPYSKNSSYQFQVDLDDSAYHFKKLNLQVQEGSFFLFQDEVTWEGTYTAPDGSTISTVSTTGILRTADRVWLHPPRFGPLAELEAFPFPDARFPFEVGKQWKGEIEVVSGFEGLDGKTVESHYHITKKEPAAVDSSFIWTIEASAIIDGGPVGNRVVYQFHSKDGFIKWDYFKGDNAFATLQLQVAGPLE